MTACLVASFCKGWFSIICHIVQNIEHFENYKKKNKQIIKQELLTKQEDTVESSPNEIEAIEETVAVTNLAVYGDLQELNDKINSLICKGENLMPNGNNPVRASVCTVCGKEGKLSNIRDHIEANHLEGVSIPCNFCDKTFRSRNGLRHHKRLFHTNC